MMLKKITVRSSDQNVVSKGVGIFFSTVFAKIFELAKNIVSVSRFGVTLQADVYNVVLTIPEVFATVLGMDSLRGATNTYFTERVAKNDHEGMAELLSSFITWGSVLATLLTVVTIVCMPQIVGFIAQGFTPDKFQSTVNIGYIVLPVLFLRIMVGVFISALNAYNVFIRITLLPLFVSIVGLATLFFSDDAHLLVNMSIAYTVGYVMYGIMLALLARTYIPWRFSFTKIHPVFWEILRYALPQIVCMAIAQMAVFVEKRTASYFIDGTIAALNNAYILAGQFLFIVVMSLFSFMQRQLAMKKAIGDDEGASAEFWKMLSFLMFVVAFGVSVMGVLRYPILQILYERHSFDAVALDRTAKPFLIYMGWIVGGTVMLSVTSLILAAKEWKVLVVSAAIAYGLEMVFVGYFGRWFGYTGIAAATSLTVILYTTLLMVGSSRLFGKKFLNGFSGVLKVLGCGAVSACGMEIIFRIMRQYGNVGLFNNAIAQIIVVSTLGLAIYLVTTSYMNVNYSTILRAKLKERFAAKA